MSKQDISMEEAGGLSSVIKTIRLSETDSTNRFMREYAGEEGELMTVATTDYQTAGRGQGRNTWESEAGKNLLFSIKTYPRRLQARRQGLAP